MVYSCIAVTVGGGVRVQAGTRAGIAGWVYRVGNTGYTLPARFARGEVQNQRSGPVGPAGGRSGGFWSSGAPTDPCTQPWTTHSSPVGFRGPLRCPGLLGAGPGLVASKGEINVIF